MLKDGHIRAMDELEHIRDERGENAVTVDEKLIWRAGELNDKTNCRNQKFKQND